MKDVTVITFSRNERKSTATEEYLIGWVRGEGRPIFPDRSWRPIPEKGKEYRVNLTLAQNEKFFFATPADPVDKVVIVPADDDYYEEKIVREFFDGEDVLYSQRIPLLETEEEYEGDSPEFEFEPIAGSLDQRFFVKMFFPVYVRIKKQVFNPYKDELSIIWHYGERQLKTKRLHFSYEEKSYETYQQSFSQEEDKKIVSKLGMNFHGEFEHCVMFKYTNTDKSKEMLALGDERGARRTTNNVGNYELDEVSLSWALNNLPSIDQTKFVSIDDEIMFEVFSALIEFKNERREEILKGAKLTPTDNIKLNDTINWSEIVMSLKRYYGEACGKKSWLIFSRGSYSQDYEEMIAFRNLAAEQAGQPLPPPPDFIPVPKKEPRENSPHLDGWDAEDDHTRVW